MPGRGEAIYAGYVARLRDGLDDAMEFLEEQTQTALAVAYPPPSSPGEAPHRRTGKLQRGVKAQESILEGSQLVGAVGVDLGEVDYAGHLEFGTSKMAARPFLRPALLNNAGEIHRRITGRF